MPTIFDQPNSEPSNSGTIADGVTIAATGVRLTNTDSGRIYTGVTFAVGGSTLVNELGGVIRLTQFDQSYPYPNIVTGSDGADTIINAGLIRGSISLGGGADVYVRRDGTEYGLDLGTGDDIFRIEGSGSYWSFSYPGVSGGEGVDRVVFANTGNDVRGDSLTGFEILVLEQGGNISNFSGYQSITLGPDAVSPTAFFNFLDCLNPLVDLNLAGQAITLQRSTLNSITGSEGTDYVEMGIGSAVTNGISLGGGDDGFTIGSNQSPDAPLLSTLVDGGSGNDVLSLNWFTAGERSYDLSNISGFEKLNVNAWYGVDPSTAQVSHISGLTDIDIGSNVTLVLSDSVNPNGRAGGGYGGGLTLEAGVVINRYAIRDDWWDPGVDLAQGDPAMSTIITNRGTITGEVRFYIGDDLYDGRDGTIGGIVYGNAGNDTLLGGAAAERLVGGYGADILEGNGGADTLTGGAGSDLFRGTASGINGDTITDFATSDKILITDASLAGFSFSLSGNTLTFTGGSLTLTGFTGQLQVSAAAGGGVQLTAINDVRNDFNGDGRSDVLWHHGTGRVMDWLGQANGGFVSNLSNFDGQVGTDWNVAGTGDFNGDGRDDVLWRSDGGAVTNWLGQANGGFASNFGNAYGEMDSSWQIAGTGDFNGDGRDDVLWHHSSGRVINWLSQPNGGFASNVANFDGQVGTDWHIVGTGDFNNDGRDDVLWRSESGAVTNWLGQANGGFASNFANAYGVFDTSWHVAGVGDFNGDGYDDVLWHHSSGRVTNWLAQANGGFAGNFTYADAQAGTDWDIAGVGDYNGDGRDDVLWRSDSGAVTNWLGQANGGFASNFANAYGVMDNSWQIQPTSEWLI